jgi:hypothetical protein
MKYTHNHTQKIEYLQEEFLCIRLLFSGLFLYDVYNKKSLHRAEIF